MENNFNKTEKMEPGREPTGERIREGVYEKKPVEEKEIFVEKEPRKKEEIKERLEEIEEMELSPALGKEAETKAEEIKELDKDGKINRLLALAEEKGLVLAIHVAKDTDDANLIDTFHDVLAKDERYKQFNK